MHGNTVDYIKYVRGLHNRLHTAHNDFGRTAHTGRTGVDNGSGDFTCEAVHEVRGFYGCYGFGLHLLHGVGQCLFRAFDTQGRDHHVFNLLCCFFECYGKKGLCADFYCYGVIADEIDIQFSGLGRCGDLERESAVKSGTFADGRSLYDHRCPDNGCPFGVAHDTADLCGTVVCGFLVRGCGKINVLLVDFVLGIRSGDHCLQSGIERFIGDIDTDGSVNVYAFIYDEEIAGLFFYFIHNLLHANIVHLQCYFRGLGIRSPCGERGANYE